MARKAYTSTSPRTISELVVDEPSPNISREGGEMSASGADIALVIGTALAVVGGAPVLFDPAASDGREVIAGLSGTSCDIGDGFSEDINWIANGPVRVNRSRIVWPEGITAPQITAAEAALTAKGIKLITGEGVKN